MPFPETIQAALTWYDQVEAWGGFFPPRHPAIERLQKLAEADQANLFKLYQCFIPNRPNETESACQVFYAVLKLIDASMYFSAIDLSLRQLEESGHLTEENFDAVRSAQVQTSCAVRALLKLNASDLNALSASEKRNIIQMHPDPYGFAVALHKLHNANPRLLTRGNVDQLMNPTNALLGRGEPTQISHVR